MSTEEAMPPPILFLKDWKLYPTAIVDDKTTNESFIRMARLYKSVGIKNHAFMLALVHPQLQGVSPFDPDLTLLQKALIRLECTLNPWYVYREIMRLPPNAGIHPIRFSANRGNMALYFAFYNHIDAALIQPRQTHKSGSVDCLALDLMDIRANNTMFMLITKDAALRQQNIERLKGIRSHLPPFLLTLGREDSDNQQDLSNKYRGNRYRTGVGRSSESGANNLGRGMTAACFQSDEGPFTPWIGKTLEAALASGTAARLQAKNSGQPYGNVFTTTAGDKDSRDGKYMYNMIHAGTPWDERFVDCYDLAELLEVVEQGGRSDKALINITMSHKQLGYSDHWLRDAMGNALRDPTATTDGVERDFLNVWSSGTASSPLSPALNKIVRESMCDPNHMEITEEKYTVRWYVDQQDIQRFMANGYFIMGADTSEAINRDAIALVVTDLRDMSTVATITINETNLLRFSMWLANFLIAYPRVTLIPEKKSTGQSIVDVLTTRLHSAGVDPFTRIFNRLVDERSEDEIAYRDICRPVHSRSRTFYDQYKSKFGFNTGPESRRLLYGNVLQEGAKSSGHSVVDKTLINEILGLVVKNERIDHSASGHDDHVMAWLLGQWFARYARNLSHYGIDAGYVMSNINYLDVEENTTDQVKRELQRRQMAEVEAIVERMKHMRDPIVLARMQRQLAAASVGMEQQVIGSEVSMDQFHQESEQAVARQRKLRPGGGRITLNIGRR